MTATAAETLPANDLSAEDLARADVYALLSSLFYAPPTARVLEVLRSGAAGETAGAESAFAAAWRELRAAAGRSPEALRDEFDGLFWGVARPRVMVYGSYYLTGFMNERPLAELRDDLARLGFARAGQAAEPEDHIAALCDVMRLLILGGADLATQQDFFARHLAPWYRKFTGALGSTEGADFYKAVGSFAEAFFDVESASFEIGN
jgi:TorA maturation chaperone TorD